METVDTFVGSLDVVEISKRLVVRQVISKCDGVSEITVVNVIVVGRLRDGTVVSVIVSSKLVSRNSVRYRNVTKTSMLQAIIITAA